MAKLELWGGIECTINRVHDRYNDQFEHNGHYQRAVDDLLDFKNLGFKTLRYPLLWEKVSPTKLHEFNFADYISSFETLRTAGIKPIVTLLHHGSGPKFTSLIDPLFAEKLEVYATAVATEFPWIESYTPVNEPLTTARFSGLYGFWYPHSRSDRDFVRALFNEVKGTILAMRAIRKINPAAKLVQTEDMGRATGTPITQQRVEFENHRRWLSFDLLTGRVNRNHALWDYLTVDGELLESELDWISDHPCIPDVLGLNHYPLSNRFLDHRTDLYPAYLFNPESKLVDVGAVDSGLADPPMPDEIFIETWERYRLPIAITEAHISGYRERQMQWLHEIWTSALKAQQKGADIRAVTVWSLLGAYDWTNLCTAAPCKQHYESGVYDLRWTERSPTALGKMVQAFAVGKQYEHPVLASEGYWRNSTRVIYASSDQVIASTASLKDQAVKRPWARPLVLLGSDDLIGFAIKELCHARGIETISLEHAEVCGLSKSMMKNVLKNYNPWAVVDTTTFTGDREAQKALLQLASLTAETNIQFAVFATTAVFELKENTVFTEESIVCPKTSEGIDHASFENQLLGVRSESMIVRTTKLFGPWPKESLPRRAARDIVDVIDAVAEAEMDLTYLPDLASTFLDLLIDGRTGIVHLINTRASQAVKSERAPDLMPSLANSLARLNES